MYFSSEKKVEEFHNFQAMLGVTVTTWDRFIREQFFHKKGYQIGKNKKGDQLAKGNELLNYFFKHHFPGCFPPVAL